MNHWKKIFSTNATSLLKHDVTIRADPDEGGISFSEIALTVSQGISEIALTVSQTFFEW